MSAIQKINPENRLVVAKMLPDGRIDHSSVQALQQWQRGPRNLELVRHGYGSDMLDILTHELGLVSVDEEGLLRSKIIVVRSEEDAKGAVMRLLGKIAEALVVRACNADLWANRRWGQVGRRGRYVHQTLDDYIAVGTGLETTRHRYAQKYRPNDPHRDVIWINKSNTVSELQMLDQGRPAGISAGLQLKVSMDGFSYIYKTDIARAKYEVPLVYFDLCNDYYRLTDAIYAEERDVAIGVDIVRGMDVDPALHDELCSHWWLADNLIRGRMALDDLVKNDLLFDAFKKDLLEHDSATVITI
ncbi:hypothetical protein PWP93_02660 [Paraburkholderia sp. A1RI-2L]|uniref:hypothetical protein n=1 Tax=Paraburkholderia sp. A1RI-2L TaxID=3028367 RepID=UPI003B76FAD8